jgi:hypothetical protein
VQWRNNQEEEIKTEIEEEESMREGECKRRYFETVKI